MRIISVLFFFPFLLFFQTCASEPKEPKLKNKPIVVARHWLENYYYKNDLEEAKKFSTKRTAAMIDTIRSMIFPELSEKPIEFEIKNIHCKEEDKRAECTCIYMDSGEKFEEVLLLINEGGSWLVDAEILNEDELLDDIDIEEMSKEFEKSLENLLSK